MFSRSNAKFGEPVGAVVGVLAYMMFFVLGSDGHTLCCFLGFRVMVDLRQSLSGLMDLGDVVKDLGCEDQR